MTRKEHEQRVGQRTETDVIWPKTDFRGQPYSRSSVSTTNLGNSEFIVLNLDYSHTALAEFMQDWHRYQDRATKFKGERL